MNGNECQCGRICLVGNQGKNKVDLTDAVFICPGCMRNRYGCTCRGGPGEHDETYKSTVETVAQEQPQPHGTGAPVGVRGVCNQCAKDVADCQCIDGDDEEIDLVSYVRERIKLHAVFTKEYFDATRNLLQSLENIIQDQDTEIKRLSEEQIKPLADFLMQQSDKIGHPSDEGACAMAIRVIGELLEGN